MAFIDSLNRRLSPVLETPTFERIFNLMIFINPLALAPQVYATLTAPSVAGVSATMWWIFAAVQCIMMLQGIKTKTTSLFWSMLLSIAESLTVIATVYGRS